MPIRTDLTTIRDSCQRLLEALDQLKRERKLRPLVLTLEKELAAAFREQGRLFIKGLDSIAHTYPQMEAETPGQFSEWWWEYIEWWIYLQRAMVETLRVFVNPVDAAVIQAYLVGGHTMLAEVGMPMSFTLANPRAVAYLENYGADLITKINGTTREYIKNILVKGGREGWGYNKVANAITERYAEFAVGRPQQHIQSRAHLIAVTESGNAYEAGNFEAAMQLQERGMAMEKHWVNVGDDKVSDGCLENSAVGWIPLEQAFPSGHLHPLRFPGCRCHAQYRRMKAG